MSRLNILVQKRPSENDQEAEIENKLIVFFPETPKLSVKNIQDLSLKMIAIDTLKSIVIVKEASSSSKKVFYYLYI